MEEQDEALEDIELNFAFVLFGKIRDFMAIKEFILRHTSSRLIYQKKSLDFLFIEKGRERNDNVR